MYSGTFDAYKKISQTEGIRGLYRGFWISCFQVNKDKVVFYNLIKNRYIFRWCQEYFTCPHTRESDIFSTRMEFRTPE